MYPSIPRCDACGRPTAKNCFAYDLQGNQLSTCTECHYHLPQRDPRGVRSPRLPRSSSDAYVGIIYIVQCNDLYKVGFSFNPQSRLLQMSVTNPYDLRIIALLHTQDLTNAENYLHWKLKGRHYCREWFQLTDDDIEWLRNIDLDKQIAIDIYAELDKLAPAL
jgi:hypothetical protein